MKSGKVTGRETTPFEERILEGIGKRVADSPIKLETGIPKTDGYRIWLPMSDPAFTFFDLEGLMGHEGGHIRFKSIIKTDIYKMLCEENQAIGRIALNIFEDARINFLLRQTFPGYYDELMKVSEKYSDERAIQLASSSIDVLDTKEAISFIINLTIIYGAGAGEEYIYHEALRKEDGSFKFKDKRLGKLWDRIDNAFETMYSYFTFSSSVLASKIMIDALRDFINGDLEEDEKEEEDGDGEDSDSEEDKDGDGKDSDGDGEGGDSDEEKDGKGEGKGKGKKKRTLADFKVEDSIEEASESGITMDRLDHKTSKRLEKVIDKIIKGEYKDDELEKDIEKELKIDKEEMEEEIEKIKSKSESTKEEDEKTDTIYEEKMEIKVDVLRSLADIKRVNGLSKNTKEIYDDAVNKNNTVIHSIRIKMNNVRQSKQNIRGARKGILSYRDLPQVVASRGRFDTPFINKTKGKGAYLVIVVDESGSMKSGGSIKIARDSAIILAEALKGTKIQYSVIGFGAVCGEHRIVEKVYKGLDEQLSPEKLGAINCSSDYCENRDGTSFKGIAKHHLRKLQGGVPLMVIISDGRPYHGGTEYGGSVAEKDTARTVSDLKKSGIGMFALSIDASGSNYLKDIYGNNCFHVVKDSSELREKLIYLVEKLVNAVK